jgi:hypothetical protein
MSTPPQAPPATHLSNQKAFSAPLPKVNVDNIFDKCVRLELPLQNPSKDDKQFTLSLDITFSDMWIQVEDQRWHKLSYKTIRANFGISRGWLAFWGLKNLSFPPGERKFNFETKVVSAGTHGYVKEATQSSSKGLEVGPEISLGPDVATANIKTSIKASLKRDDGTKDSLSESFNKEIFHVQVSGDSVPQWSFTPGSPSPFRGKITGELATFHVTKHPCGFNADFKSSHESIRVLESEVEGFAPSSVKKKIVVNQKAQKLIWILAEKYMSRATWKNGI